jgi:hypothetical protein
MISGREMMIGCTCGCLAAVAAGFVATPAAAAYDAKPVAAILPAEMGGVRVPDTALAKGVVSLVREVYPDPVFNHVTRSFVFGSKLGRVLINPECHLSSLPSEADIRAGLQHVCIEPSPEVS